LQIANGGGGILKCSIYPKSLRKTKGFTLIELLSVIIIIGVIALIVTPVIIGVIRKQEKNTFEESIHGILKAIEIDMADDNFNFPREYYYDHGTLTLTKVGEKEKEEIVKTNGKYEGEGKFIVDEDGDIIIESACNEDYCASNSKEDPDIVIDKNDGTNNPVKDPLDPVITLNGEKEMLLEIGSIFNDPGVVSKTYGGEALEYTVVIKQNGRIVEEIDTSIEGSYTITYSNESNGKIASVTRKVVVLDMKPEITITEADNSYVKEKDILITVSSISPNKVNGFSYSINGEEVIVNGLSKNINLNKTGEYEIVVTVKDDNNHTNSVTKKYLIDATEPVITFNPEIVELTASEVENYDLLTGVIVTDNIDGTIDNSKVKTGGSLNTIIGEYTVTYKVSDNAGNESTKTRTFRVIDRDKPEITINPNEESNYVQSKSITITARDNVEVSSLKYVIIKDNVRGEEIVVNGTSTNITLNETGEYKIEVTAIDNSNNIETKLSGIYKIDRIPPIITVPEDSIVKVTEVGTYNLEEGVEVRDNSNEEVSLTVSGSLSARVGEYEITYTAKDTAENTTTIKRIIKVVEADGPILNFDSISTNNSWVTSKTVKVTATDDSKISTFTYETIKDNVLQGIKNGTISNNSGTATISLKESGIYKIKLTGSDEYGNSTVLESGEYKIDTVAPTITAGSASVSDIVEGTSSAIPGNYFTINSSTSYSGAGSTVCKEGSTTVTNTSSLSVGSHTITCTVTRGNGLSASLSRTFTIKSAGKMPIEIVNPSNDPNVKANDPDGNPRYTGSNPNNYVNFNGKLFRIIGIFNGQMKIIQNDNYGNKAWDSNKKNVWSSATLNSTLNNTYWNTISSTYQAMVDQNYSWKIGGRPWYSSGYTVMDFYNAENEKKWTGKIALMSVADYGYASTSCAISTDMSTLATCGEDNWMAFNSINQWTVNLAPHVSTHVWLIYPTGLASQWATDLAHEVHPVLYLKSTVKITSGTGTSTDPYQLSL